MKRRSPWWLVAGALVAIVAGVGGYRAYDYVMWDAKFCLSCHNLHDEHYASWLESSHSSVTCHGCHVQSFAANVKQLVTYVAFRPTEIEAHAVVDHTQCGACHLSDDDRWHQVAATSGHRVHFEQKGIECVECHSAGIHEFVRPSASCGNCHAQTVMGVSDAMAEQHCTACHDFLATEGELAETGRLVECGACHAVDELERVGWSDDAPMRFPCDTCHKPHDPERATVVECATCHPAQAGLHSVPLHQVCGSCHVPHRWKPEPRAACETCHVTHTEHYPGPACFDCHSFRATGPSALDGANDGEGDAAAPDGGDAPTEEGEVDEEA